MYHSTGQLLLLCLRVISRILKKQLTMLEEHNQANNNRETSTAAWIMGLITLPINKINRWTTAMENRQVSLESLLINSMKKKSEVTNWTLPELNATSVTCLIWFCVLRFTFRNAIQTEDSQDSSRWRETENRGTLKATWASAVIVLRRIGNYVPSPKKGKTEAKRKTLSTRIATRSRIA